MQRCGECGAHPDSTIHLVDHPNAEIRMAAHQYVPAKPPITAEELADRLSAAGVLLPLAATNLACALLSDPSLKGRTL